MRGYSLNFILQLIALSFAFCCCCNKNGLGTQSQYHEQHQAPMVASINVTPFLSCYLFEKKV